MDNFNPASLSPEAFNKLALPSAEEAKRKRLAARSPQPVDEIAEAEAEEAAERAGLKTAPAAIMPPSDNPNPNPKAENRIRVTFELPGGFYTVPAIGVKVCKYGLMVLMPTGVNDATFAPSPGTEVVVHWGDKQAKCFSPGILFDMAELNCMAIILVRAEE